MSQLLLLAFTVTAAPGGVGTVVHGAGYRTGQPVVLGQVVRAPTRGVVSVLTSGGCLLRLLPGAQVRLGWSSRKMRCPEVQVLAGRVRLLVPGKKLALPVMLGNKQLRLILTLVRR